jgi:TolA-binding protein
MLLGFGQVTAQESAPSIIKETETHSVFKGLFLSVWSRLRAINPQQRQSAKSSVVYTAGIRGAEATETLIQPYWKGDLTNDENFQKQLKKFSQAQQLMDKGDLQGSAGAFDDFIKQYGDSNLLPNALFGKGLSYAGTGNNSEATSAMEQFVDANPNHALIEDARQILEQLN